MMKIILWILRILAALIMLQTLYFKFTAAPESIYIFSTLGMEPYGRIGTGIGELIASILLLYPRTTGYGAVICLGLMSGALFFHITKLGIVVQNDGGLPCRHRNLAFKQILRRPTHQRWSTGPQQVAILRLQVYQGSPAPATIWR